MSMAYTWAWEQLGSPDLISNHKTAWLALFIGSDFAYYWVHRWSHEYQFLWAGHSVHHSSTQYNLSTALRQSWWQGMYNWSIMLWCAVAPPIEAQRTRYLVTVYQFWVHTCHIDRCGVLEEFLMTPSHHRVHHDARVHKNFAGVLLWDRLFGTFMREPERPVCKFGSRFDPDLRDAVRQFDGWRRRPLNSLIRGPGFYTSTKARSIVPAEPTTKSTSIEIVQAVAISASCVFALCVSQEPLLSLVFLDCAVHM